MYMCQLGLGIFACMYQLGLDIFVCMCQLGLDIFVCMCQLGLAIAKKLTKRKDGHLLSSVKLTGANPEDLNS